MYPFIILASRNAMSLCLLVPTCCHAGLGALISGLARTERTTGRALFMAFHVLLTLLSNHLLPLPP